MSAVQLALPALSTGTAALVKQSSIAARRPSENALLKAKRLKRAKMRTFAAMTWKNDKPGRPAAVFVE